MNAPENIHYTKDHEWVRREGAEASIGITDFAQSELGDIVFVELPAVGTSLEAGQEFGTIESVKAVSEVFAPVTGEVTRVNEALRDAPETLNTDPYGEGWILKVRPTKPEQFSHLLSASEYAKFVEEGAAK